MRRFFLSGILAAGLAVVSQAASTITGYVQTAPQGVQQGNPNVTTITAGQVTDTGLSAGGCVTASNMGLLTVTGVGCGGGGGVSGGGTINNALQYSGAYYSFTGSSNVISGISGGIQGQYFTSDGAGGPPFWTTPPYYNTSNNTSILGFDGATADTWLGISALGALTSGSMNSAFGHTALSHNTSGADNNAFGEDALQFNISGNFNDAVGLGALENNTSGSQNDALGYLACQGNSSGSNLLCLGYNANPASNNLTNAIAIGPNATVQASNTMQLGNGVNVVASTFTTTGEICFSNGSCQTTASSGGSFIQNTNSLQAGSTFYTSSGTVLSLNASSLTVTSEEILDSGVGIGYGVVSPSYNLDFECGSTGSSLDCGFFSHSAGTALQANDTSNNAAFIANSGFTGAATAAGDWAAAVLGGNNTSNGGVAGFFQTTASTGIYVTATSGLAAHLTSSSGLALQIDQGGVNAPSFNASASSFSVSGSGGESVTYGITVGSETINGTGAGAELWNEGADSTAFPQTSGKASIWDSSTNHRFNATYNGVNSTYTIVGTSTTNTTGHYALFLANGDIGDGGGTSIVAQGSPSNIQYNSAGSLGGSNDFQFSGSSVTVLNSSMTLVNSSGSNNSGIGLFNVYSQDGNVNDGVILASFGSVGGPDQFWIKNGQATYNKYGMDSSNLLVGDANNGFNDVIHDVNSTNNLINFDTTRDGFGAINIETNSGNIVLMPGTNSEVVISTYGVTVSTQATFTSSMTVIDTPATKYVASFSTGTSGLYALDISSTGHINSQSVLGATVTSCGTSPSYVGSDSAATITTGSGSPTTCSFTFAVPYGNAPTCVASDTLDTAVVQITSVSNKTVTMAFSASLNSGKIFLICIGSD